MSGPSSNAADVAQRRAISAREASDLILNSVERTPDERVPLAAALGSVLTEDIIARISIPPWRSASMDGYALRGDDIASVPRTLRVMGESVAGGAPPADAGAGAATRIMTGACVPPGADTVVRVEDTDCEGDTVIIRNNRDAMRNVRAAGEDFRNGDVLLRVNDRVTPAAIGVLASAGVTSVSVFRAPTVSVVASGDELVRADQFESVLRGARIVSSNSYSLPALVRAAGGVPRDGGIITDDPQALRAAIDAAMSCDIIITSGGVSVGDRDFTRRVMRDMGADLHFWRARIRPGGPVAFATIGGRPWFALPGNPVSAMVTFELFVRPAILKMRGEQQQFRATQSVTLDEPVTISGDLTHYLRAVVTERDGALHARLTGTQSSAALTSMLRANALLIVPEGRTAYAAGETLNALPLDDFSRRSASFPT